MEKQPVDALLLASQQYPLLSAQQERILTRKIRTGDERAFETLLLSNIRLVVSVAKRYSVQNNNGLEFSDLVHEGVLGLIRAINGFDPDRGWRFSTYATWWIKQAISRGLANKGSTIRVPVHVHALNRKMTNLNEELRQELHRDPTSQELADKMDWSVEKLDETLSFAKADFSLDETFGESDIDPYESLQDDEKSAVTVLEEKDGAQVLGEVLQLLDQRSQEVIRWRHGLQRENAGDGLTLRETGKRMNLSPERVRQIEINALKQLRSAARLRDWHYADTSQ